MPGYSLLLPQPGSTELIFSRAKQNLAAFGEPAELLARLEKVNESTIAVSIGSEHHPLHKWKEGRVCVYAEGYVYGAPWPEVQAKISRIVAKWQEGHAWQDLLRSFVCTADGDFCVFAAAPGGAALIFNDALGRLPVFGLENGEGWFVTRTPRVVIAVTDTSPCAQGYAESMMFGFPIGGRSLTAGMFRLPAGSAWSREEYGQPVRTHQMVEWNFDHLLEGGGSTRRQEAVELAESFMDACRRTAKTFEGRNLVVSLSGGFDSRAVAAGLKRAGAPLLTFTRDDTDGFTAGNDLKIAKVVAETLGLPWEMRPKPEAGPGTDRELAWMTDGLNYLEMAFLLPMHRDVRASYGADMVLLTGDNGDRSLDPQGPPWKLGSREACADFILQRHCRLDLETVSQIIDLDPDRVLATVKDSILAFPEKDPDNLYRHFIFDERLRTWNYLAEDRNRNLVWHCTPLSSLNYTRKAYAISDRLKRNWGLTADFIEAVDPDMVNVPYANWMRPVRSIDRYIRPLRQKAYECLPGALRLKVRRRLLLGHSEGDRIIHERVGALWSQIQGGPHPFRMETAPFVADTLSRQDAADLYTLLVHTHQRHTGGP